jgi:hypothetical protein
MPRGNNPAAPTESSYTEPHQGYSRGRTYT